MDLIVLSSELQDLTTQHNKTTQQDTRTKEEIVSSIEVMQKDSNKDWTQTKNFSLDA